MKSLHVSLPHCVRSEMFCPCAPGQQEPVLEEEKDPGYNELSPGLDPKSVSEDLTSCSC